MSEVDSKAGENQNPDIRTVNELFLRIADAGRSDAILYQDEAGAWKGLSSNEIYRRVRAVALVLTAWNIQRGDRVMILSENRWEWQVTDFAILAIGAVGVPVYPTLTTEQVGELLRDSGARVVFVSTRALYEKVATACTLPGMEDGKLEHVVLMDSVGAPADVVLFPMLTESKDARDLPGGSSRDAEFDALVRSVQPDEVATLIYTSGTTGEPKGVMLTQGNIASNVNLSTRDYGFTREDSSISYLPLSHITARALDYAMFFNGAQVAYCPQFEKLVTAMQEVRPTVLVGVPRVYEKIRHGVEQKSAASPVKKKILAWAVAQGGRSWEQSYDGKQAGGAMTRLADKLVYSKIREAFGGRVRRFISGGAPLGVDTAKWFASVGIAVFEGYGLTETSPVIAINSPVTHRLGSVGRPIANIQCKLAIDDELLVRGPGVFVGYWHKPEATRESINAEGWFATGDIARIDSDGFLFITDRKKELIKTSGGKLIAPQPIEGKLKTNVMVAEAALVGDKRKFASVLISPNFAALEAWARQQGINAQTRRELVANPAIIALFEDIVKDVNATLANFETMKRVRVVAEEWTLETGELTPSRKLKRRVITTQYAELVAALYADEATAHGG